MMCPPPVLLEVRRDRLHPVERRLDVHADHLVDVLVGEIAGRSKDALADVIDPDIDVIERGQRFIPDPRDVFAPRDVGDDGARRRHRAAGRRSDSGGDAVERICGAGGQHEGIAAAAKLARQGGTNAGAGAGNHDDSIHVPMVAGSRQRAVGSGQKAFLPTAYCLLPTVRTLFR